MALVISHSEIVGESNVNDSLTLTSICMEFEELCTIEVHLTFTSRKREKNECLGNDNFGCCKGNREKS